MKSDPDIVRDAHTYAATTIRGQDDDLAVTKHDRSGTAISIDDVLTMVNGRVDGHKLAVLREFLQRGLSHPLSEHPFDDPMRIRRALVHQMRLEGASRGVLQAYEQFFMGIVRRVALTGLVPVPPEGPWTLSWQSVLDHIDSGTGVKAALRSLAGWATENDIEPGNINDNLVNRWGHQTRTDEKAVARVLQVVCTWKRSPGHDAASEQARLGRLKSKAMHGTVKAMNAHTR